MLKITFDKGPKSSDALELKIVKDLGHHLFYCQLTTVNPELVLGRFVVDIARGYAPILRQIANCLDAQKYREVEIKPYTLSFNGAGISTPSRENFMKEATSVDTGDADMDSVARRLR